MLFKGVSCNIKNVPALDTGFIPLAKWNAAYLKGALKPLAIAVERNGGLICVYDTFIHGTPEMAQADRFYTERLVKFLLWARGGWRVVIAGDESVGTYIRETYASSGARQFDCEFMSHVYEKPFTVDTVSYADCPEEVYSSKSIGRNLDGCRIGFDAGGSDRKVSAVIDGETVFSEEVVWHPKTNSDPEYHFEGIVSAMKTAASKMPRVDAIGISSAGIYIDNHTMVASLFLKVAPEDFEKKIKDIYIRATREIGDVPVEVVNDGDVTALAGAMSIGDNRVLGIAMGTSEAGGYVDCDGNITGWLNELAFAPVDAQECAMEDEWSGDIGCGVKYFSQDGVIKLAAAAGMKLDGSLSPGEKLKIVQSQLKEGDRTAERVFESIGCYLGHTIPLYARFYDVRHILLLGRVMSGKGGDIILSTAKRVLAEEYPDLSVNLALPDDNFRRVGQSMAAASLPAVR